MNKPSPQPQKKKKAATATYEGAREHYLPNVERAARGALPPDDWEAWKKPAGGRYGQCNELDDYIAELSAASAPGRGVRLRDREELFKIGVLCPYFVVREAVIHAVDLGEVEAAKDARRVALLEDFKVRKGTEAQARKIAAALDKFARALAKSAPAPDLRDGLKRSDLKGLIERKRALDNSEARMGRIAAEDPEALREWADRSAAWRETEKPNPADKDAMLWTVLITLARTWFLLTGTPPAKGSTGPFKKFAAAALSGFGKRLAFGDAQLRDAMTYTRDHVDDFNRPEALAEDLQPPGVMADWSAILDGVCFVEGSNSPANAGLSVSLTSPERITSVEVERRQRKRQEIIKNDLRISRDTEASELERAVADLSLRKWWFIWGHGGQKMLTEAGYELLPPPPSSYSIKERSADAVRRSLFEGVPHSECQRFIDSGGVELPAQWKAEMKNLFNTATGETSFDQKRAAFEIGLNYWYGNAATRKYLKGLGYQPVAIPSVAVK